METNAGGRRLCPSFPHTTSPQNSLRPFLGRRVVRQHFPPFACVSCRCDGARNGGRERGEVRRSLGRIRVVRSIVVESTLFPSGLRAIFEVACQRRAQGCAKVARQTAQNGLISTGRLPAMSLFPLSLSPFPARETRAVSESPRMSLRAQYNAFPRSLFWALDRRPSPQTSSPPGRPFWAVQR